MSNIDVKECKFKIQKEDFNSGEPYCALFDKSCSDLNFICDKNCTVYEMQKQLQELKEENTTMREALEDLTINEKYYNRRQLLQIANKALKKVKGE